MTWLQIKAHLVDAFNGFVGAVAAAAGLAALNYIGAHIPDVVNFLAMVAAGIGGVKTGK